MTIGQTVKPIIRINRSDTYERTINIRDEDGVLINCTGWTIYFTVRTSVPATSVVDDSGASISKSIAGVSSGIHTLTLTPTDTDIDVATYFFDIQVKKDDGSIHSIRAGSFIVEGDITRSSA